MFDPQVNFRGSWHPGSRAPEAHGCRQCSNVCSRQSLSLKLKSKLKIIIYYEPISARSGRWYIKSMAERFSVSDAYSQRYWNELLSDCTETLEWTGHFLEIYKQKILRKYSYLPLPCQRACSNCRVTSAARFLLSVNCNRWTVNY